MIGGEWKRAGGDRQSPLLVRFRAVSPAYGAVEYGNENYQHPRPCAKSRSSEVTGSLFYTAIGQDPIPGRSQDIDLVCCSARNHEFLHAQRMIDDADITQPTVERLTDIRILCRSHHPELAEGLQTHRQVVRVANVH